MMLITQQRLYSNSNETLGIIKVDDDLQCHCLEDEYRKIKVAGETRIYAGKYPVTLRTEGSIHPKYERMFPDIHKGMLWIRDTPQFEYCYFHIGNDDDDTYGCPLVGQRSHIDDQGTITLRNSKIAYRAFYERVIDAAWHGSLMVEIKDEVNAANETR